MLRARRHRKGAHGPGRRAGRNRRRLTSAVRSRWSDAGAATPVVEPVRRSQAPALIWPHVESGARFPRLPARGGVPGRGVPALCLKDASGEFLWRPAPPYPPEATMTREILRSTRQLRLPGRTHVRRLLAEARGRWGSSEGDLRGKGERLSRSRPGASYRCSQGLHAVRLLRRCLICWALRRRRGAYSAPPGTCPPVPLRPRFAVPCPAPGRYCTQSAASHGVSAVRPTPNHPVKRAEARRRTTRLCFSLSCSLGNVVGRFRVENKECQSWVLTPVVRILPAP